jgi:hypothetical protein
MIRIAGNGKLIAQIGQTKMTYSSFEAVILKIWSDSYDLR